MKHLSLSTRSCENRYKLHSRSVLMGSDVLGAVARIDLIESDEGKVIPVDYKRGSPPDIPEGAWEPERVQVCLQGLLLRENGCECYVKFPRLMKRGSIEVHMAVGSQQ